MSALAVCLKERGHLVCGFDRTESEKTAFLQSCGIPVNDASMLSLCDFAIASSAISLSDPNVLRLKELKKPVCSRAELLSAICSEYPCVTGVSGTHGKTTCTALCAHMFRAANKKFTLHVGGEDVSFGNYRSFGNEYFITELCEYKNNLRFFSPTVGIVLNVDDDHLESYSDFAALQKSFCDFALRSEKAIVGENNRELRKTLDDSGKKYLTFSLNDQNADYCLKNARYENGAFCALVTEGGNAIFEARSEFLNMHDKGNLLSAVAAARIFGISPENIATGVKSFCGVKRRNEFLGYYRGCAVIADYAHHPAQLQAVICEYENKFSGGVTLLFQPHTYSRTRRLFDRFADVLKNAERLFVFDVYAARESYDELGSSKRLCEKLKNSEYVGGVSNMRAVMERACLNGKPIIVLGAGDIYDEVKKTMKEPPVK